MGHRVDRRRTWQRDQLLKELRWPDSLGLLYSAFTYYTGFKVNSGEYKVMGLAPYGEPKYVGLIFNELMDCARTVRLPESGVLQLPRRADDDQRGVHELFGGPPRVPETSSPSGRWTLRGRFRVCEEIMLRMARPPIKRPGSKDLCLAGGVALNCVGNGRLLREGPFEESGSSQPPGCRRRARGGQLIWHRYYRKPRTVDGAATR